MKKIIVILLIITILLIGCSKQELEESICNKPYFEYMKGQCCLDSNDNSICDKDEIADEPKEKELEEESIDIESPETIARKFAKNWESEQYGIMYGFFVPELKQLKTKEEFIYLLEESKIEDGTYSVRLDDIAILNETTALAYFHVNGYSFLRQDEETPAFHMTLKENSWKFDAFAGIFFMECVYRQGFLFSECPLTNQCNTFCGKSYYGIGLPKCTPKFKCECKCVNTEAIEKSCKPGYVSGTKQTLVKSTCTELSKYLQEIDIIFEENRDTITLENLENKKLTQVYILINEEFEFSIKEIKPKSIEVINKEEIKNKITEKTFKTKNIESLYVYSEQGRFHYGIRKALRNIFPFKYP